MPPYHVLRASCKKVMFIVCEQSIPKNKSGVGYDLCDCMLPRSQILSPTAYYKGLVLHLAPARADTAFVMLLSEFGLGVNAA
jgi:hypothetical protein